MGAMLRALWFLIRLVAVVGIVAGALSLTGTTTLAVGAYGMTVPTGILFVCMLGALILALAFQRWGLALGRAPRALALARQRRRAARGDIEMVRALSALSAGDTSRALIAARKAHDLLPDGRRFPLIILAHTARLDGKTDEAARVFDTMLTDPETAFLGLRGLVQAAVDTGDDAQALALARRAQTIHRKPQRWVLQTVFDLEIKNRDLKGAAKTLEALLRLKDGERETWLRHRTALDLIDADAFLGNGNDSAAEKSLRRACARHPAFAPAVNRLATLWIRKGRRGAAIALIEKAWGLEPHPDLIASWKQLAPGRDRSDGAAMRWMERLVATKPDHPESQIAAAMAAMHDSLWTEARAYLVMAEKLRAGPRVYRLWADLEDKTSRSAEAARAWMDKAAAVRPDPAWVCALTGLIHDEWVPFSSPHGHFNTIRWMDPLPGRANAGPVIVPADLVLLQAS